MKYLFIAAHVDDIELSCGGWIQQLVTKHEVKCVTLSHVYNRVDLTDESGEALRTLGVDNARWCGAETRRFNAHENYVTDVCYEQTRGVDTVVTHDICDRHPDHSIVAKQIRRVFNGNLLTFMAPWNGNEDPNFFVELSQQNLDTKIQALNHYKSQAHRPYMSLAAITAQARYNGLRSSKLYAEGFKIVRLVGNL